MIPAFPVPIPDGVPSWLVVAAAVGIAVAGFTVLVWQAVRAFRATRDDDEQ